MKKQFEKTKYTIDDYVSFGSWLIVPALLTALYFFHAFSLFVTLYLLLNLILATLLLPIAQWRYLKKVCIDYDAETVTVYSLYPFIIRTIPLDKISVLKIVKTKGFSRNEAYNLVIKKKHGLQPMIYTLWETQEQIRAEDVVREFRNRYGEGQ